MMAGDSKPPKSTRNLQHNWVEQKGKRETEREKRKKKKKKKKKGNQDKTSTLERELRKRKGTHTLGSHLADRYIS